MVAFNCTFPDGVFARLGLAVLTPLLMMLGGGVNEPVPRLACRLAGMASLGTAAGRPLIGRYQGAVKAQNTISGHTESETSRAVGAPRGF